MTVLYTRNINSSLKLSTIIFTIFGVWPPSGLNDLTRRLCTLYSLLSLFLTVGVYIIIQTGDLVQVWGDLTLMSASLYLLFTNIAYVIKVAYVISRRELIQKIIFDGDDELDAEKNKLGSQIVKRYRKDTLRLSIVYYSAVFSSVFGLTFTAEENQLPLRAWYPYDATKKPAYQLTYAHQIIALAIAAAVNLSCDLVVTSMVAQCRCRLRLIALSLRNLCDEIDVDKQGLITAEGEEILCSRFHNSVTCHQLVLEHVKILQHCFSVPILAQLSVSSFIICTTAYQMAFESNLYRLMSMIIYLVAITMQVYIYCVEGNNLVVDSHEVFRAAYDCPWYTCTTSFHRLLLMIMIRSKQAVKLSAVGFVELSLDTFMSIIKASYTLFTVLQSTVEA